MPIFIQEESSSPTPITSMPGISRHPLSHLNTYCETLLNNGIHTCALFPVIPNHKKTPTAHEALNPEGLVCQAIRQLKSQFPDLIVISDIALDTFSSDGHDGIVKKGQILNDETVSLLQNMAVIHAEAGADMVAPSDMMDGRIGAIRGSLDTSGFQNISILAYTAKYASHLYGPFRDALDSVPKEGDKKTYQLDYRNKKEAIREALLDANEGADILMVKPATLYLDIIQDLKQTVTLPIAAYHVSGEYAMVKAAAAKGWLESTSVFIEALTSIKRSGADMILTYAALEVAQTLRS